MYQQRLPFWKAIAVYGGGPLLDNCSLRLGRRLLKALKEADLKASASFPLQRSQEVHQILTLGGAQVRGRIATGAHAVEVVDDACGLAAVCFDSRHDVRGPTIVQEEQSLTDAPERRRAELRAGGKPLPDIVPGTDVMEKQ